MPTTETHSYFDQKTGETVTYTVTVNTPAEALAYTQAETAKETNEATLRQDAEAALANLAAYRDLASPTNAQTVATVKLLCRVCIGLIRLVLRKLDAAT